MQIQAAIQAKAHNAQIKKTHLAAYVREVLSDRTQRTYAYPYADKVCFAHMHVSTEDRGWQQDLEGRLNQARYNLCRAAGVDDSTAEAAIRVLRQYCQQVCDNRAYAYHQGALTRSQECCGDPASDRAPYPAAQHSSAEALVDACCVWATANKR